MLIPFDRKRLARRNHQDDADHQQEAARRDQSTGLQRGLDLSMFVRQLADATGTGRAVDVRGELEAKSRIYVQPLRLLAGRT